MMIQVDDDNCPSRTSLYDRYNRIKNGREDLGDDERSGRPRTSVNEENIKRVREFIQNEPKSSLRYMEMESRMYKDSIHRILVMCGRNTVLKDLGVCSIIMHLLIDAHLCPSFWPKITF